MACWTLPSPVRKSYSMAQEKEALIDYGKINDMGSKIGVRLFGWHSRGDWAPSASQQIHELFYGKPGIGDDAAQRAGTDLPVIGDYGTGVRFVAAQNHMASGLAAENEAGAFDHCLYFTAGKISGEFGHAGGSILGLRGLNFNEFLAGLNGHRIACLAAIFDVKLHGLANVAQGLGTIVTLAHTTR